MEGRPACTVLTVRAKAWCHHIPRLMIPYTIATLLEVEPRQPADWFWVAYSDTFDWVTSGLEFGGIPKPERCLGATED